MGSLMQVGTEAFNVLHPEREREREDAERVVSFEIFTINETEKSSCLQCKKLIGIIKEKK